MTTNKMENLLKITIRSFIGKIACELVLKRTKINNEKKKQQKSKIKSRQIKNNKQCDGIFKLYL